MPLPNPTDGDSAAFMAELLRHQRRIYLFIASLLGNPTDIEDVYQQTCLALWKKRDQLPEVRDFFAWACGFARNEALNQIRSNSRSFAAGLSAPRSAGHARRGIRARSRRR